MSAKEFVESVRRLHLLADEKLSELPSYTANDAAKPLADTLVQREWLTPFQSDLLLQNRGDELLLGSYVLLEKLGEGGMGAVYKARNWKLDRICALKLIRKDRLKSRDAVRRFYREIRAAAQLDHPNVVRAYDADTVNNVHFFAMEYVEGVDLAILVKNYGPPPVKLCCEYIRQAALGLQHAYERGLVHRDIKPANLLLVREGGEVTIKVLDMGLVRQDETTATDHSGTITQVGTLMGTPDFMAPEQTVSSHTVDIRADLYSLGCSLFFLLTGSVPFPGGSLTEKLVKHQKDRPPPIEQLRSDVPLAVSELVQRLMAKKRDDRFLSPRELAAELHKLLATPHVWAQTGANTPHSSGRATASQDSQFRTDPFWQEIVAEVSVPTIDFEPAVSRKAIVVLAGAAVIVLLLVVWVMQLAFRTTESNNDLGNPHANSQDQKRSRPPLAIAPFDSVTAKKHQKRWADYLHRPVNMKNSIGMKLILIPPGTFKMGAGPEELKRMLRGTSGQKEIDIINSRYRQHRVRLTRPFYIGATEVTKEEWHRVVGGQTKWPSLAVENVDWNRAENYCRKLSELPDEKEAGRRYRLPTEAEWEYVCRAGTTTYYSFGDRLTIKEAAISDRGRPNRSRSGSRKPNVWGVYDMHGNQLEWCLDWFGSYGKRKVQHDPLGPPVNPKKLRVVRGGSYAMPAFYAMSAYRRGINQVAIGKDHGFRVVCEIDEGWINLLAGVNPLKYGDDGNPGGALDIGGVWQYTKDELRSPGREWSRIKLPVQVDRDYRVEVAFTPKRSKDEPTFHTLLPVVGRSVCVQLGAGGGPRIRDRVLLGHDPGIPLTPAKAPKLIADQRYVLNVSISGSGKQVSIEIRLDGKLLTEWTGDPKTLSQRAFDQSMRDTIWLMPWGTVTDIHTVRLRRLPPRKSENSDAGSN